MNDIRTLFADAADDAPAGTTLVRDVFARSAAERRRAARRRLTLAATASATVVAGGSLVALRDPSPASRPVHVALGANGAVQVTPDGERHCGGFAHVVPGTEIPRELRLVAKDPSYRQAGPAIARRDQPRCGTAAVALALVDTDRTGATRRQLMLSGPLPAPLDASGYEATDEVPMRGGTGRIVVIQGAETVAAWTDRDGRSWALWATGATREELVAYADALTLPPDGSASLPPALARGYRDLGTSPALPPASRYSWSVDYVASGHRVSVSATEVEGGLLGAGFAGARAGAVREVTVNGTRGIYTSNGGDASGLNSVQWQLGPDLFADVSGLGLTLDQLLAAAEVMVPAADDHPAVAGSA